jgi:MoxR-like ATPase
MSVDKPLLEFLKNKRTTFANYPPIVIKILLEKGINETFSASLDEIKEKIILLNFDREDFQIKNAIDAVLPALKNYILEKDDFVSLNKDSFSNDQIGECLKICNKEIAKWHVTKIMKDENDIYAIQAGLEGIWLEEFKKSKTVGVDYSSVGGTFDLTGMTKDEISAKTNGKAGTELHNISQLKKGDIVAIRSERELTSFGIVTGNYFFDSESQTYPHKVNIEYLDFGTNTIDGIHVKKAIFKTIKSREAIRAFLSQEEYSYFILRHNSDSPWDDLDGKYHFGRNVPNQKKLRDAGVNTHTIWYTKKNGQYYFWGYGIVKEIEVIRENEEWNLIYDDFQFFEKNESSLDLDGKFLKLGTEIIKKQIENVPNFNNQHAMTKITKKIYRQITAEDLSSEDNEIDTVTEHSRIIEILKRKKNIILYGPPGTGKTFTAKEIAKQMNGVTKSVTFHQSYGYEEFIEGIRPQPIGNAITYPVKPGVFKKFCQSLPKMNWRQAAIYVLNEKETSLHYKEITKISIELEISPKDTWQHTSGYPRKTPWLSQLREMTEDIRINNKNSIFKKSLDDNGKEIPGIYEVNKKSPNYENEIMELESLKNNDLETPKIFIIDEINRGNISKIFGELITIIENDKRGTEVTLSYSGEQFSVPSNVFIIGTMNTADQSLTHIDAALKRRFSSIEVMPDSSILKKGMKGLPELLDKINEKVREKISRDNQIGHSYFMTEDGKPITEIKELQFVFATDIIPLLRDYFYDSDDDLKEVLGEQFIDWNEGSDRNVMEDWQNNAEVFRTAIKKAYDVTI